MSDVITIKPLTDPSEAAMLNQEFTRYGWYRQGIISSAACRRTGKGSGSR
ncbi:hypothetical protein VQ056_00830 [Paenibacillus sp. JTLBN-2024]